MSSQTSVPSDIEIARQAKLRPILDVGAEIGIPANSLVPYGHTKAKIEFDFDVGFVP